HNQESIYRDQHKFSSGEEEANVDPEHLMVNISHLPNVEVKYQPRTVCKLKFSTNTDNKGRYTYNSFAYE
ncbi:unnamed protein product, partial [Sphenostylis stenocarpa]